MSACQTPFSLLTREPISYRLLFLNIRQHPTILSSFVAIWNWLIWVAMNSLVSVLRRSTPVLFLSQIISSTCVGVARNIVMDVFSIFWISGSFGWIWIVGFSCIILVVWSLGYKKTAPFEDCFRSLWKYISLLSKKTLMMSVSIPTWYCILFAIHIFEYIDKIEKCKYYFFSTLDPFFSSIILYHWASRRSRIRSDSL
jgi:hypothetical protein